MILSDADAVAEALIVHDLALAEIFYGISYVGIVAEAEDVVVGDSCLLLGGQILMEVGDDVPLDSHVLHVEGYPRGGDGIDPRGVIHEVGGEGGILDLLLRKVAGELVEDGGDHLQMGQLFGALRSIGNVPLCGISTFGCLQSIKSPVIAIISGLHPSLLPMIFF